jgi:hypothetical protein
VCKSAYGLSEEQNPVPLSSAHVPSADSVSGQVVLDSIFHHRGVNALAEDQTLNFSPGLTLVYGDNGTGKTGYIRILKSACRARGQENILGNVVSGAAPHALSVSIKYQTGDDTDLKEWSGAGDDEFVSRVSVFDTQSAAVYLTEKTDVAFRPFGLDLFDRLVKACKAVRTNLEREQRALAIDNLQALKNQIPEGTAVAKLISNVSSLTKPEAVQSLAQLSPEEMSRKALLEKSLRDLQASDPKKLIQQMNLRERRVRSLSKHLMSIEESLSDSAISVVLDARAEGLRKSENARRLREATFPAGMLEGTGSDLWARMWDAARDFSEQLAYPNRDYPVVEESQCLLCQQDIDHEAADRLKKFEEFVSSTTERELRNLRDRYSQLRNEIVECVIVNEVT